MFCYIHLSSKSWDICPVGRWERGELDHAKKDKDQSGNSCGSEVKKKKINNHLSHGLNILGTASKFCTENISKTVTNKSIKKHSNIWRCSLIMNSQGPFSSVQTKEFPCCFFTATEIIVKLISKSSTVKLPANLVAFYIKRHSASYCKWGEAITESGVTINSQVKK